MTVPKRIATHDDCMACSGCLGQRLQRMTEDGSIRECSASNKKNVIRQKPAPDQNVRYGLSDRPMTFTNLHLHTRAPLSVPGWFIDLYTSLHRPLRHTCLFLLLMYGLRLRCCSGCAPAYPCPTVLQGLGDYGAGCGSKLVLFRVSDVPKDRIKE